MIKFFLDGIFWRELQRQKKFKKRLLIQIFLTTIGIGYIIYIQKIPNEISIYIPFIYAFIIQHEVFFSDLNDSIETFLSIPLSINKILLKKSIYILIKCLFLSLISICILYFSHIFNIQIYFNLNYICKIMNIIFLIFLLNYMIGNLVLILGKKSNVLINIIQSLLFFTIMLLSTYYYIICNVIIISINIMLFKIIDKENIIRRSS